MQPLLEKAKLIRCLISDVDGVLTDGRIYVDSNNNDTKAFHVHDGMGIKLLMAAGIEIGVITTSQTLNIDLRMKQLGIQHYFKGQVNKLKAFEEIKNCLGFEDHEIAYIGDDLPDLPLIQRAGFGVAVANALPQVKEFATFVTEKKGGKGAVREVCDLILTAQNKQNLAITRYLNPT